MTAPLHFGLVGWPLDFSLSPALHKAAFQAAGIDATYALIPTPPGDIASVIDRVRSGELAGLNVTVPHKLAVREYLDELAPSAQIAGAVNTVEVRRTQLVGHNTDLDGFRALWQALAVPPGPVAVLGAGGAARAVAYELAREGRAMTIVARDEAAAETVVSGVPGAAGLASVRHWTPDVLAEVIPNVIAVINATPLPDALPVDSPLPQFLADLVAWPVPTPLVQRATAAGVKTVGGIEMLVVQAAHSFALWTELKAPLGTMEEAARAAVAEAHLTSGTA